MRDIFYKINNVGSDRWKSMLDDLELREWNWISNNQALIKKHQKEIGLKENLYLGRLLFALLNKDSFNPIKQESSIIEYSQILSDNNIENSPLKIDSNISILIQTLENNNSRLGDNKFDIKNIISMIQQYQNIIDGLDLAKIENSKQDFNLSVIRRSGLVFYQLASEGFRAKISITHIYKIYNQYKFIDYYKVDNEANWNHEHPIFKRIRQQRRNALDQYQHRKLDS